MLDIIVNPAGGGGRTLRKFRKEILPLFKGADYRVHYSTKEHGIEQIARELTTRSSREQAAQPAREQTVQPVREQTEKSSAEFVNLVVVGGDGTMNEVLNGIADFDKTRVGLIPAGSGNDLAKDLELTKDLKEIVGRIRSEVTYRRFDVGKTIRHETGQMRYFAVSSSVGFDAQCCAMAAAAPMKGFLNRLGLGKLIYLYEAIKLIFTWKSSAAELTWIAGETAENRYVTQQLPQFVFAAAMNHRYEGGGFMMGPGARDDDGLFETCIVHDLKIPDFFRLFPSATKGAHVKQKKFVQMVSCTGIRVKSKVPLWVHTDGEAPWKSADVEICMSDRQLNLMM